MTVEGFATESAAVYGVLCSASGRSNEPNETPANSGSGTKYVYA
jgi:hypothetical protein